MLFTVEERSRMRRELIGLAERDKRLSGVAITGSAAADREDRWSDIDLAFGVADANELDKVLGDFTGHMYDRYRAVHHVDVTAGAWIYRVFFLPGTLQVDLAFAPSAEFRPLGATFKLISGSANPLRPFPSPKPKDIMGLGWLYALHARTCILRERPWQAEYMISGVRNHALTLACERLGLPSAHGRGFDLLPGAIKEQFSGSFVRELQGGELWRALDAAVRGLLNEIRQVDEEFAARIENELLQVATLPRLNSNE